MRTQNKSVAGRSKHKQLIKEKMKNLKATGLVVALVAGAASSSFAATINVLWYTGGVQDTADFSSYTAAVNNLVSQEENPGFNVSGSVNTWNVTFWAGGAKPAGSYNVLINASPEGGWNVYPSYTALSTAITTAGGASSFFGNRVMLTGQDADWHYQNYPGPSAFNGPAGFLIDAINWAGSGTGMGGVMLDPWGSGLGALFAGDGNDDLGGNNTVDIPAAFASYPINLGLTSAGLSDWDTAAHESYDDYDPSLWTDINETGDQPITIVSAATASGGTSGAPDAGSTALLGTMALGFLGACRRKLARVA
jgi:hypothetical protein